MSSRYHQKKPSFCGKATSFFLRALSAPFRLTRVLPAEMLIPIGVALLLATKTNAQTDTRNVDLLELMPVTQEPFYNAECFSGALEHQVPASRSEETKSHDASETTCVLPYYNKFFRLEPKEVIPVLCSKSLYSLIGEDPELKAEVIAFIKKTRAALKLVDIHPDVMQRLKKTKLRISIRLGLDLSGEGVAVGVYFPSLHKIILHMQPVPPESLVSLLQNELHHAAVAMKNFKQLTVKLGSSMRHRAYPQLTASGEIDARKERQLIDAQKEFSSRIEKFRGLWKRRESRLSKQDRDFLNAVKALIVNYHQPSMLPTRMKFIETLRDKGGIRAYPDGSERILKRFLNPSPLCDMHIFWLKPSSTAESLRDKAVQEVFLALGLDDAGDESEKKAIYYHFSHPEDDSLVCDFIQATEGIEKLYLPGGIYGRFKSSRQLMKFQSNIDSLPAAIKKFFAPKFCQFFSAFHDVENYCQAP